jgi:5-deoxy-glucuronate isomerase
MGLSLVAKCGSALGLNRVVDLANPLVPHIGFALLKGAPGTSYTFETARKEVCLVTLSGTWWIEVGAERIRCERRSVFAEKPTALYLPSGTAFRITAEQEGEIAFCESEGSDRKKPIFITPAAVAERRIGHENCRRTAYDILHKDLDAHCLLVGETISEPGHWSSFPPHKHDTDNEPHETALEELYFFKLQPKEGYGMQRVYTDDRSLDQVFLVEDGSVSFIPRGYHPVVTAPGCAHYYLWVLAGRKRLLTPWFEPCWDVMKR